MFMLALTMIMLFTACAFAVDLGSFYARASRIQRAADSASLAGVVWMPGDFARAQTDALAVASKNGFSWGVTVSAIAGNPYQLKVTIVDNQVPRYFSTILTKTKMSITRSSVAEFAPVVPLGSPDNRLGNYPLASPAYTAYLWASISGPYTDLTTVTRSLRSAVQDRPGRVAPNRIRDTAPPATSMRSTYPQQPWGAR
ncbi:MAG: Tad domain-containing protein [Acidimicrobiales bacterium]